ncbi:MAG: hypothetical protein JNM88_13570 [Chitinophagaceae bacterium]|nr:hypothetical protein [Chitinophagaceae bacterium]
MFSRLILMMTLYGLTLTAKAQIDSAVSHLQQLPSTYLQTISSKADKYYKDVSTRTEKTLTRLAGWESKIKTLLEKVSPETAAKLFANDRITFGQLLQKYKEGKIEAEKYMSAYNEYRDKLTTSLQYLDEKKNELNEKLLTPLKDAREKVDKVNGLLSNTDALEKLIRERKKELMGQAVKYLSNNKYFKKISKESYYYIETLRNYKELFSDPKKAEELAMKLLKKIPAFNSFLERNSFLSSVFGNPGAAGNPNGTVGLLQSRASVMASAQTQLRAAGPNPQQAMQQVMQQAQGQLNQLRQQVARFGNGGSDFDVPDFKPNPQKSKKFLQKIELSANVQSTRHNNAFPLSSDFGFSAGYKPSEKLIIGIGGSYKMGWGTGFNDIRITHQGVGLRSFIDWKIKGGVYLSGGYEQNYFSAIRSIQQLRDFSAWKSSALLGVSKKYNLGKKKKGEMKLLYDFFSHTKIPRTSAVLFRVGFGL